MTEIDTGWHFTNGDTLRDGRPLPAVGALQDIMEERARQEAKWGEQNHYPHTWLVILGEEFGEACQAALEERFADYRKELVQVAAVAIAAIECIDRKTKPAAPAGRKRE